MKSLVEKNKILEFVSGSFLYGTNVQTSDTDMQGLFVAPKNYYLGLDTVEEVDLSIISKTDDGKNDCDAIDRKFNELRKFVKLAMAGNPNCIEQVFVPNSSIIYISDIGRKLLDSYSLFPSKLVKQRFIGYALSQIKKSKVKPDNFIELTQFKADYESLDQNTWRSWFHTKLVEFKYINSIITKHIKFHTDFATVGGLNFNLNVKIKDVYNSVCVRLSKASNRQDGWLKHGLDLKYSMHSVRLMFEGMELLKTGKIIFPLTYRDILLDIRNGKLTLQEIEELTDQTFKELDNFESELPSTPNHHKINQLLIDLVEEHWALKENI